MNTSDIIVLDKKNTLYEMIGELNKHFPKSDLSSINMAYRSFRITYSFLPEIWGRIVEDIKLNYKNSGVEANLHYDEGYILSKEEKEILSEYKKHKQRLNLDVEDWFIHANILFSKYIRITILFYELIATEKEKGLMKGMSHNSFNKHIKESIQPKMNKKIQDIKYQQIIKKNKDWYYTEIKDVRDDLIQHETIPRFWGSSIIGKKNQIRFSLSRFKRDDRYMNTLYNLRDKYKTIFPNIEHEINYFNLQKFFEINIEKINNGDKDKFLQIRKRYGRDFPDMPQLSKKISDFFSEINDYFIIIINNKFSK